MDKKMIGKFLMWALGAGLTLGASLIDSKRQDQEMKEAVAEEVAKAFENQAKGS